MSMTETETGWLRLRLAEVEAVMEQSPPEVELKRLLDAHFVLHDPNAKPHGAEQNLVGRVSERRGWG